MVYIQFVGALEIWGSCAVQSHSPHRPGTPWLTQEPIEAHLNTGQLWGGFAANLAVVLLQIRLP